MQAGALIAAFLGSAQESALPVLHATRYAKQVKIGWCGATGPEEDGTHYVPIWTFDGRDRHGDAAVCIRCSAALCALAEER